MSNHANTARDKLIVALDLPDRATALTVAKQVVGFAGTLKVGLELFTRCGPSIIEAIKALEVKVFLDLKFHDIPNTVAGAVRSACELEVDYLTLHLGGGPAMVEAAAQAAAEQLILLGVTVLTSADRETLEATGVGAKAVEDQVLRLAKIGFHNGIHGLVASPHEAALLRQIFGQQFPLITPGVRPQGSSVGDQKRVMTPADALEAGASQIVVGRPITAADDPAAAAARILSELG